MGTPWGILGEPLQLFWQPAIPKNDLYGRKPFPKICTCLSSGFYDANGPNQLFTWFQVEVVPGSRWSWWLWWWYDVVVVLVVVDISCPNIVPVAFRGFQKSQSGSPIKPDVRFRWWKGTGSCHWWFLKWWWLRGSCRS